jgi:ribosome-associated toxin RatA of RatAB toxin-antitoxin module
MSSTAEATEVFNCTPEQLFAVIADYERYPEFLTEVKSCRIVEIQGSKKLVEYEVSLIKTFKYSLWLSEVKPTEISWDFAGGDVFKTLNGYWKLSDEAGRCRAVYYVDASFGLFVPKTITKSLLSMNLPNMMSAYHKRVSEIYGK